MDVPFSHINNLKRVSNSSLSVRENRVIENERGIATFTYYIFETHRKNRNDQLFVVHTGPDQVKGLFDLGRFCTFLNLAQPAS